MLTDREKEIINLVAQGFTNTEIANELFISFHTVSNYMRSIFQKLSVNNRDAAVLKFFQK